MGFSDGKSWNSRSENLGFEMEINLPHHVESIDQTFRVQRGFSPKSFQLAGLK